MGLQALFLPARRGLESRPRMPGLRGVEPCSSGGLENVDFFLVGDMGGRIQETEWLLLSVDDALLLVPGE